LKNLIKKEGVTPYDLALASKNDECREFAQFLKSKMPAADKETPQQQQQQLNAQPTTTHTNSTGKAFYFIFS
jgi:hypothetical protein